MKQVYSFIVSVLLLLALGISGMIYVFYDAAQYFDKVEAQKNIGSNDHLVVLRLSVKEFAEQNNTKEVWANGKLYDISSYSVSNGVVEVLAFHDEQEENLVQGIVDSFEPGNTFSADHNFHLARHHIHPPSDSKILAAAYCVSLDRRDDICPSLSRYIELLPTRYTAIIKPPPRVS